MNKAKPGDVVIVTNQSVSEYYLSIFRVVEKQRDEIANGNIITSIVLVNTEGVVAKIHVDDIELLEPGNPEAISGDTVILTRSPVRDRIGRSFFITDRPDGLWANRTKEHYGFLLFKSRYCVLKRSSPFPFVSCSDCKGTGKIVLLTSTIACKYCDGMRL